MFSVARKNNLRSLAWSVDPSHDVEYIEAWKFSQDHSVTADNPRHARLHDSKIEEWLTQEGDYAIPTPLDATSILEGGIRIIISEREYYRPASFSMSKQSYLRVEEEFNLPQATLPALVNESGVFSRHLEYDKNVPGKLKRIGIIIKASQKYQVGNYGLSISHDLTTNITTGLLHGTGVMLNRNDFPSWGDCPSVEIFNLISAVPHLWTEPLLLPTILLQHHIYRVERFCTIQLEDRANHLQNQLGMSRAGRLSGLRGPYEDPARQRPIKDAKVNLHNLTGEMNTCITEIIWFCRVSDWECDCVDFLSRTLSELRSYTASSAKCLIETREIQECIEYLSSAATGLKGHNNRARERLQSDFNVLCSQIAQIDNRLTAKMAATSSRDSSAMKALAFITTLFLPGTFIATIFSTGMFNWQSTSSDPKPQVVSSYFWVYWVFTVPLTILVAFSWRFWWAWEKQHLDQDVLLEIENIEDSASVDSKPRRGEIQKGESTRRTLGKTWQSLRRRKRNQASVEKDLSRDVIAAKRQDLPLGSDHHVFGEEYD